MVRAKWPPKDFPIFIPRIRDCVGLHVKRWQTELRLLISRCTDGKNMPDYLGKPIQSQDC